MQHRTIANKSVAAVVVTYNRLEMLEKCVACLKRQSSACGILVIDNASTDGTERWLEGRDDVQTFRLERNTGGAGGFNYGMRKAAELGYAFAWVMDDDCLPEPDALEKLLEADEILDGGYGWLSSVALWTDGGECRMNRQKLKKNFYERSPLLKYGLVMAEQATFVSLFLRTDTIRRVGLPIREFFIWGDDIEFTRRIAVRENIPCFVAGQSRVVHAMRDNNGSSIAADRAERIDRYRYAFRNEAYLYRQEGVRGVCYYLAKCGLNVLRILAKAPDRKWKRCGIVVSSMLRGAVFRPRIEMLSAGGSIATENGNACAAELTGDADTGRTER